MSDLVPFPQSLREFVSSVKWTFAKTYAETWPHEYIVRDRVDEGLFVALVHHITAHGYEARFYRKPITYFDEDGLVYWTMGEAVEVTTIINRCRTDQTYEYRLKHGTLPEQIKKAERPTSAIRQTPTRVTLPAGRFAPEQEARHWQMPVIADAET